MSLQVMRAQYIRTDQEYAIKILDKNHLIRKDKMLVTLAEKDILVKLGHKFHEDEDATANAYEYTAVMRGAEGWSSGLGLGAGDRDTECERLREGKEKEKECDAVAASVGVTYDWALTLGQEVELVWRQRWSLMTILYLTVRYLGLLFAVLNILINVPTILLTDAVSMILDQLLGWILYIAVNWMYVVIFAMLRIIVITRLHAMYQQSRKMLIFLIVIFLADTIFNVVVSVMSMRHTLGEEYILSGTYECATTYGDNTILLNSITWIFGSAWEVLVLFLATWIAIKHFRELRQHSTGGVIKDCFTVLIKSHMFYFLSFVAVSVFNLVILSPEVSVNPNTLGLDYTYGTLQILTVVQMFVLGPRLILGIRDYTAKLVTDSDAATNMTSIAFQERVHISTGSGV
ncbi:hypothetical protein BDR06DRAFT_1010557 [Suillus hirtellus]|nr:hypothetical protein BDR06DRAFT_1010557 [Suillus hirtellus]